MNKNKAPTRFELVISCLLDRRFNQLSHGATLVKMHEYTDPMQLLSHNVEKTTPNVGLEPTTLRLRVSCSTD